MMPQTETPTTAGTVGALPPAPTPGYRSTEFLATMMAAVSLASGAIPAQYAPLVAGVVGVYVAARTLLKAAHAMGYAKSIPDLPALPPLPAGATVTQVTQVPK